MNQEVNSTARGCLPHTNHRSMDSMRAPKSLRLTLTKLDQDLVDLAQHYQNVAKICHTTQSHPLCLVQFQLESPFLIANTFRISNGTSMVKSAGSLPHIALHG